jgi:hypothetical protein
MTQPEITSQPEHEPTQEVNRILAIVALYGSSYFAPLLVAEDYSPDNDIARTKLRNAYDGMPKQLDADETRLLGIFIRRESGLDQDASPRECSRAEVRTLHWLGSISAMRGDEVTARSVSQTLRHKHGLAGKRAAVSLWYERTIQN